MSTVYAPELVVPKLAKKFAKLETFMRANIGVDPDIIAHDLGITPRFVIACQRKLGLRKLTGHVPRAQRWK